MEQAGAMMKITGYAGVIMPGEYPDWTLPWKANIYDWLLADGGGAMNLWRITGTFFSKLLTVALVMIVLCTMSQADAAKKEKPQVIWSPNIFSLQKDDMLLNYPGVKDKIIHAINRKLTEL